VAHQSKDGAGSDHADLLDFVLHKLPALTEAFANLPLMQVRVATPEASVTMVKARLRDAMAPAAGLHVELRRGSRPLHEYIPDGEPGRAFDTVTADVVGLFRAAPDLPVTGEEVAPDRILGYIEALKVRTPVRSGIQGRLVGQIAEDGQPVDFGETLFVVDSGPAQPAPEETPAEVEIEPPRI
jgi:acetyl-CoA carboxylase biotin carboxyl carrier protein